MNNWLDINQNPIPKTDRKHKQIYVGVIINNEVLFQYRTKPSANIQKPHEFFGRRSNYSSWSHWRPCITSSK